VSDFLKTKGSTVDMERSDETIAISLIACR
jgi:hypothetical protein